MPDERTPIKEEPDPADLQRYRDHLRAHFDDIHDVSMRFHMDDPSLGGLIALRMAWADGRLHSAEVLENETGSDAEAQALIDALGGWQIDGLAGPTAFNAAFRIRLVGSDHPEFPHRAILTGSVRDPSGAPLHGARISFSPSDAETTDEVPPATANREGIFIRTLIPPGSWDLVCSLEGRESANMDGVSLAAGQHRIIHFTLEAE
jgi:hypothetical protein